MLKESPMYASFLITALLPALSQETQPAVVNSVDATNAKSATEPAVVEQAQQADSSSQVSSNTVDYSSTDIKHQLLDMNEDVTTTKKQVFNAKATLGLLRELVVQGNSSGAKSSVWHVNKLSNSYTIEAVSLFVDGESQYAKSDVSGGIGDSNEILLYDERIKPGQHSITVEYRLRGNGFGMFNYVNQYGFNVQSSSVFTTEEGQNCRISIQLDDHSFLTHSFLERPFIAISNKCSELSESE